MLVKELISELRKYPEETPVYFDVVELEDDRVDVAKADFVTTDSMLVLDSKDRKVGILRIGTHDAE